MTGDKQQKQDEGALAQANKPMELMYELDGHFYYSAFCCDQLDPHWAVIVSEVELALGCGAIPVPVGIPVPGNRARVSQKESVLDAMARPWIPTHIHFHKPDHDHQGEVRSAQRPFVSKVGGARMAATRLPGEYVFSATGSTGSTDEAEQFACEMSNVSFLCWRIGYVAFPCDCKRNPCAFDFFVFGQPEQNGHGSEYPTCLKLTDVNRGSEIPVVWGVVEHLEGFSDVPVIIDTAGH